MTPDHVATSLSGLVCVISHYFCDAYSNTFVFNSILVWFFSTVTCIPLLMLLWFSGEHS